MRVSSRRERVSVKSTGTGRACVQHNRQGIDVRVLFVVVTLWFISKSVNGYVFIGYLLIVYRESQIIASTNKKPVRYVIF